MPAVPRQATGSIETHPWRDGRTVSYKLRVRVNGVRHTIALGSNHEGWNEERARVELDRIMRQVERGTWEPPTEQVASPRRPEDETLLVTASRWWQRKRGELSDNTQADYRWRLDFVLADLAEERTSAIDIERVDEFRDVLAKQITQHGRPMKPRSVNMVLDVLAQILDDAVEYRMLPQNPARGKRRRMKVQKSRRSFLDPDMVIDLLQVAGEWEDDLRKRKRPDQCYGRRALLAGLCLAGPRIEELLLAPRSDLDIHGGRLRVGAKTPAGHRDIELTAYLLCELRSHLASTTPDPSTPIFHSRNRNALNPSNIRNRLLSGVVKRANERRGEEGKILIPDGITPHALRRTFASLALTAGRDPRWVMAQLGHTDARLTLNVYAQVMQRKQMDRALIWNLMRFPDEAEEVQPHGRAFSPTNAPTELVETSGGDERMPGE